MFTSSHVHIFSSSHLLIFASHLHIFSSWHLHTFTSSHLHIFSSSHPHILTSSHLHIFTFSLALLLSCPLALLPSCSLALFFFLFPECVARVPVSLWGSGGWGCVRSTLCLCSQPFATVRSRPKPFAWGPYGRAYGKFCRSGHFWRFQTSRCFVSRGRRGTSCHSDVFCNASKLVLCGRRNTFATFSEDVLQFSWQAQHFGGVHRHFAWQAQHFRRVVLRVFCKSHGQGCVKWRQGANTVAGVAFCEMGWKLTEASHEKSILRYQNFRFMRKLVGKRRFWCYKVSKWRKSRTKCSFCCSHVSRLESLVFLWPRRVDGGSCKPSPFRMFPSRLSCRFAWQARHLVTFQSVLYRVESVKIGGSLARNARFAAPTCLVSSRWFSCGLAVSMGEAANPLLFECFQAGCHVVLSGRRGTLWHSNLFFALHTLHSQLPTLHSTLYTLHSTLYLYTLHSTLHTLHFALYTPHSTLYT